MTESSSMEFTNAILSTDDLQINESEHSFLPEKKKDDELTLALKARSAAEV